MYFQQLYGWFCVLFLLMHLLISTNAFGPKSLEHHWIQMLTNLLADFICCFVVVVVFVVGWLVFCCRYSQIVSNKQIKKVLRYMTKSHFNKIIPPVQPVKHWKKTKKTAAYRQYFKNNFSNLSYEEYVSLKSSTSIY